LLRRKLMDAFTYRGSIANALGGQFEDRFNARQNAQLRLVDQSDAPARVVRDLDKANQADSFIR